MNEIVEKWESTGLLENVPDGDDKLLLSFAIEYVANKLINNIKDFDDVFIEISIPAVRRLYELDSDIFMSVPAPMIWSWMKEAHGKCNYAEEFSGIEALEVYPVNIELLSKKTFKIMKAKYEKYI